MVTENARPPWFIAHPKRPTLFKGVRDGRLDTVEESQERANLVLSNAEILSTEKTKSHFFFYQIFTSRIFKISHYNQILTSLQIKYLFDFFFFLSAIS